MTGPVLRGAGLFIRLGVRVIPSALRSADLRPASKAPVSTPGRRASLKAKRPPTPIRSRGQSATAISKPVASAAWQKAKPITLAPSANIDDAIAIIATACRDHWQVNMAAAMAGEHPEGIHQVRVGLRRFRVLLSLVGDHIPEDQLTWLKAETKLLSDALGPARDLEVFLTELLAPLTRKAADDSEVAALLRVVRERRDKAHAIAAAALSAPRYRRFMARLNTWIEGRGWVAKDKKRTPSAQTFARTALNRRLAKLGERTKTIKTLSTAKLHRLRITIKKLRYGMEFFHSVLPDKRAARISHDLKAMQEALGYVNDRDVAKRMVAMLSESAGDVPTRTAILQGGQRLTKSFDESADAALPRAARAATRLRAEKPL
jgi:CHAD domain-containing protein